jgi:hypothetical protein
MNAQIYFCLKFFPIAEVASNGSDQWPPTIDKDNHGVAHRCANSVNNSRQRIMD